MAAAPPRQPLVPDFDVLVDGVSYAARFATGLRSLTVEDDVSLPGMAGLELTGTAPRTGLPLWLDDDRLVPGAKISVRLGYAGSLAGVFEGQVAAVEAEFAAGRPPVVRLRAYDARQALQRGQRTRTFTASTDGDIASQVGRAAGVPISATASDVTHDYVVQAAQSDFAFLMARAEAIGFELVVRDGRLLFRPAGFDAAESLALDVADMLEFAASLSIAQAAAATEMRGWDVKRKVALVARSAAGSERAAMGATTGARMVGRTYGDDVADLLDTAPAASQAELDAHARARFNDASLSLVHAEGALPGRTDLLAGTVLRVSGAGASFSGAYYVTAVRHRYAPAGGFVTRFAARRNAA